MRDGISGTVFSSGSPIGVGNPGDVTLVVVGRPDAISALAKELSGEAPAPPAKPAPVSLAELRSTPIDSIVHGDKFEYRKTHFENSDQNTCWRTETEHGPVATTSSILARMRVHWGPLPGDPS